LGHAVPSEDRIRSGMTVHTAEKLLILKTLEAVDGNKTKAAELLGITSRTLRNKLDEYGLKGIEKPEEEVPAE
jgi:DNA-binding NtrC family response regulator